MPRRGRDLVLLALGVGVGLGAALGFARVRAHRAPPAGAAVEAGGAAEPAAAPRDHEPAADRAAAPHSADALGATVADLKRRLATADRNRAALQDQLAAAQERLARLRDGGRGSRHEFDLTPADWADLARDGTVKFRIPCDREANWTPGADTLNDLGLTPDEAPALTDAYKRSYDRSWGDVRPLCAQALGSAEVADRLGRTTCTHLILDLTRRTDEAGVAAAMRQVGEIRSGQRPAPPPNAQVNPVLRLFLALTGELPKFEADLAQTLGPEDAHRIAFSRQLCSNQDVFGGIAPPRDGQPARQPSAP